MANISAQETTPGHIASTACFAFATVSNPSPATDRLSDASFSASLFGDAIIIEASHPYKEHYILHINKFAEVAVMEEQTESTRSSGSQAHLLYDCLPDSRFSIRAACGVEVLSQLPFPPHDQYHEHQHQI